MLIQSAEESDGGFEIENDCNDPSEEFKVE